MLRTRAHSVDRTVTLESVGFGQDFALWSRRGTSQSWNVSLQAGVLAQFDLDRSTSYALLNYHGSYPYGQFFREDVDDLALGIHIGP